MGRFARNHSQTSRPERDWMATLFCLHIPHATHSALHCNDHCRKHATHWHAHIQAILEHGTDRRQTRRRTTIVAAPRLDVDSFVRLRGGHHTRTDGAHYRTARWTTQPADVAGDAALRRGHHRVHPKTIQRLQVSALQPTNQSIGLLFLLSLASIRHSHCDSALLLLLLVCVSQRFPSDSEPSGGVGRRRQRSEPHHRAQFARRGCAGRDGGSVRQHAWKQQREEPLQLGDRTWMRLMLICWLLSRSFCLSLPSFFQSLHERAEQCERGAFS